MALIVKNVDEKTIRKMAHDYLSGSYVTLKSIATKYRTTATTVSNILWRGIAENIIDTRVAKSIYHKVIDKPSLGWYQRKMRWDEAFDRRQDFIEEQEEKANELLNLQAMKEYYEHTIASYHSYFTLEYDGPSLESLEDKLAKVNERIKELS